MGILDTYKLDLKALQVGISEFQYALDDGFFESLGEETEIRKGRIDVFLKVKKTIAAFELTFKIQGTVVVPCDRCLDDMEQKVDTEKQIRVKMGPSYVDEDELITIPEDKGIFDISWHVYEFIALSLPIKHVHEDGQCNQESMDLLSKYLAV